MIHLVMNLFPEFALVVSVMVFWSAKSGQAGKGSVMQMDLSLTGSNVTLVCNIESDAANDSVQYLWRRNGQILQQTQLEALTLYSLTAKDEGTYTCQLMSATNHTLLSNQSDGHPLKLLVLPEVAIAEQTGNSVHAVMEGSALSLTCQITNRPRPPVTDVKYTWSFWSQKADPEVNLTDMGVVLTIQTVHRNQSGVYSCHISSSVLQTVRSPPLSSSIVVQVQYLDSHVTLNLKPRQTMVAGDNVTMTCLVDSLPNATLTWLHEGRILHTVESNQDVFSFTATGCNHSGEYQCRADNGAINQTAFNGTRITVECPPSLVGSGSSSHVTEVSGREGEDLTLSVNASGNPPPVYTWSGPALGPGQSSSIVTLHRLLPVDAGTYIVNVSNVHGSFLHTFLVTVHTGGIGSYWWLSIIGAAVLVPVLVFCFVYGKRWFCGKAQQHDSSPNNDENQQMEPHPRDYFDKSGRRRQSEEVADYYSGGSMDPYWSIDSADLPWLPQPDPQQHPPSHDSGGLDHEIPLNPEGLRLPRPHVSLDEDPYPASDVTSTCDVTTSSVTDSVDEVREGFVPGERSSMPLYSRPLHWEEDQLPEDSEAYCEWSVVSSPEARFLCGQEDDDPEYSLSYCEWNLMGSKGTGPLYREEDQLR